MLRRSKNKALTRSLETPRVIKHVDQQVEVFINIFIGARTI